jgi:hypothetical protein
VTGELPGCFSAADRHGYVGDREQRAAQREFAGPSAIGEEAVVGMR